jgi:hypothetical protein
VVNKLNLGLWQEIQGHLVVPEREEQLKPRKNKTKQNKKTCSGLGLWLRDGACMRPWFPSPDQKISNP